MEKLLGKEITRRNFLKVLGAGAIIATTGNLAGCAQRPEVGSFEFEAYRFDIGNQSLEIKDAVNVRMVPKIDVEVKKEKELILGELQPGTVLHTGGENGEIFVSKSTYRLNSGDAKHYSNSEYPFVGLRVDDIPVEERESYPKELFNGKYEFFWFGSSYIENFPLISEDQLGQDPVHFPYDA